MTQTALTREQVLAMEPMELSLAVAEHIFKAKVIGKEGRPETRLLIGHFGYNSWQPLSGERWQNAVWRNSDEKAWLDCPRYAEDISAAYMIGDRFNDLDDSQLKHRFMRELIDLDRSGGFGRVHSSPADRCKAALLAVLDI